MESVILFLNILILALIVVGGVYYYQKNSSKKLEQEIEDQTNELNKKDEINELKSTFQDSFQRCLPDPPADDLSQSQR